MLSLLLIAPFVHKVVIDFFVTYICIGEYHPCTSTEDLVPEPDNFELGSGPSEEKPKASH